METSMDSVETERSWDLSSGSTNSSEGKELETRKVLNGEKKIKRGTTYIMKHNRTKGQKKD